MTDVFFLEDLTRDYIMGDAINDDHKKIKKCSPIALHIVSFSSTMMPYIDNCPSGYLSINQDPADHRPRLVPQITGVTEHGASVLINVFGFSTFLLLRCPDGWKKANTGYFETELRKQLGSNKVHLRSVEHCNMRSFRGWSMYKKFPYIKVYTDSDVVSKIIQRICEKGIVIGELGKHKITFKLADTKIESLLKFIHVVDIETGGWIKIKHYVLCETELPKTSHVINISMEDIKKFVNPNKAPMLRLSFDLEVNSRDGHSFPNPKIKEDRIFQISNNFRVEGSVQSKLKILLTLKKM